MDGREVGVLARGGGWIKSGFIFDITWAVSIYGILSMDEHCSKNLVHINSLKPVPTLQYLLLFFFSPLINLADEEAKIQGG